MDRVLSDIEIAQQAKLRPITDVAADIGLDAEELDLYGKYKAKIPLEVATRPARGRLVVVTSINATPAGEGKSTVTVGLTAAGGPASSGAAVLTASGYVVARRKAVVSAKIQGRLAVLRVGEAARPSVGT